jgi:hypothetical protein
MKIIVGKNTMMMFFFIFSSITDIVEEEMRLENRTLAAQLRTEAQERRSLKKESAALTSEVTFS